MKSILDPSFRYTSSFNTDLSKTFARVRRDHRDETAVALQPSEESLAKVLPIVSEKGGGRVMTALEALCATRQTLSGAADILTTYPPGGASN